MSRMGPWGMDLNGWQHYEAVSDTGAAYTQFRGWVLTCIKCSWECRGETKAKAIERMQDHYDHVCGDGRVTVTSERRAS